MITNEIVGFKKYSFTNPSTGNTFTGYRIFCNYEDNSDNELKGVGTVNFTISNNKLGNYLPKIGDHIFIGWADKKNFKVDSIMLLD